MLAAKYSVLKVTHNLHSELTDKNMLQSYGLIQLNGSQVLMSHSLKMTDTNYQQIC